MDGQKQCLICLEQCFKSNCLSKNEQPVAMIHHEHDGNGIDRVDAVMENAQVIFLLRHILQVPKKVIADLQKTRGNPSDWNIFVCNSCSDFVNRAKDLQQKKIEIMKAFEVLSSQFTEHLVHASSLPLVLKDSSGVNSAVVTNGRGRGKRKKPSGPPAVYGIVRNWVIQNHSTQKNDMMNIIAAAGGVDKYVSQKQADLKFKTLGPGKKLTKDPDSLNVANLNNLNLPGTSSQTYNGHGSHTSNHKSISTAPARMSISIRDSSTLEVISEEKRTAALAAEARIQAKLKTNAPDPKRRIAALIKEQAKQETIGWQEQEGNVDDRICRCDNCTSAYDPGKLIVSTVLYKNSYVDPDKILSKQAIENLIRETLLSKLYNDTGITSVYLIKSCNGPPEMVEACLNKLETILDNIINHPSDPKFKQIRCGNRVFKNFIRPILGAEEFLGVCGFEKAYIDVTDVGGKVDEEHLVFEPEEGISFINNLMRLKKLLRSTNPILVEVDRNIKVMKLEDMIENPEFPSEFHADLNAEEQMEEQKLKSQIIHESDATLKQQLIKKRDDLRMTFNFSLAAIRIRFPDSLVLQGIFGTHETTAAIISFVRQNLVTPEMEFQLIKTVRKDNEDELDLLQMDESMSIKSLMLFPCTVLDFRDVGSGHNEMGISYLDPELVFSAL